MYRFIFGIAAIMPTAGVAEPVNLSCFYYGFEDGEPRNLSIVLDETKATALWTDLETPNPQPKLLTAVFQPNLVDIAIFPRPGVTSHFLINRTTLNVRFVASGKGLREGNGRCELLEKTLGRKF